MCLYRTFPYASGVSSVHYANIRGNRRLSGLLFDVATLHALPRGTKENRCALNPLFHQYYQKKISEGKTKKQALKAVQRRLINIIYSVMKHKREYVNPPMARLKEG